jgi:hypothetical protein
MIEFVHVFRQLMVPINPFEDLVTKLPVLSFVERIAHVAHVEICKEMADTSFDE